MHLILLNAGSSSLKCSLLETHGDAILARGLGDWAGEVTHYRFDGGDLPKIVEDVAWRGPAAAVTRMHGDLRKAVADKPAAVCHRVVHGGEFTQTMRVTAEVRHELERLIDLAPLHNPPSLEALAAAEKLWPDVPHFVAFDTAFHATMLPEAKAYPLPRQWTDEWGIRRYGFHGLSHAHAARRAAQMLGRADLRLVVCHLGHGCSASAIANGCCLDTTMGFTPLEGLMMATRCGSIDPSIPLFVQRRHGLTPDQVEETLLRHSGLFGVYGDSADMRQVLAAEEGGNAEAALAVKLFTHRVRQAVGSLAVTLGGLDAIVFTGGVGENSAVIRERVCRDMTWLGVTLDEQVNRAARPDRDVAAGSSRVRVLVIESREDLSMAHDVVATL